MLREVFINNRMANDSILNLCLRLEDAALAKTDNVFESQLIFEFQHYYNNKFAHTVSTVIIR